LDLGGGNVCFVFASFEPFSLQEFIMSSSFFLLPTFLFFLKLRKKMAAEVCAQHRSQLLRSLWGAFDKSPAIVICNKNI
jgi:hypothetical protein